MNPRDIVTVLGARGMLGTDLVPELAQAGCEVRALDLPECDIAKPDHLVRALDGVQVAVNCAAYTNVDKAEENPQLARAVNAEAVGTLAKFARERNIYVVHISTDFVFDGCQDEPYAENEPPHPVNVYGDTKWKGEQALRSAGIRHAILRVQWSYGRGGVHFIAKLLERAQKGGELKVVDDQIGAPTWTRDMARAILCLIRRRAEGLFHFANTGYTSRFDVARFVAQRLQLANPVVPCSSDEFPVKAARPKSSRFNTAKIQAVLDHPIRSWQEALSEFLEPSS